MLNVIMLMEKFSKHDYNWQTNDLIILLFVFIKQKQSRFTQTTFKLALSMIAIYIPIEDMNLTRNFST